MTHAEYLHLLHETKSLRADVHALMILAFIFFAALAIVILILHWPSR